MMMVKKLTYQSAFGEMNSQMLHHKVLVIDGKTLESGNLDLAYLELAKELGQPIICEEDPETGKVSWNSWTQIKYIPDTKNNYKNSCQKQPLHTDYGYFNVDLKYSFFYCIEQAAFGGATTFIDANLIAELLKKQNPVLFDRIIQTEISFGRAGNGFAFRKDYILKFQNGEWLINWNYYRALDDAANQELIEAFKIFLDNAIESSGELITIKLNPKDAVFFRDAAVLHGRNSFIGERHLNKGAIMNSETDFDAIQLVK